MPTTPKGYPYPSPTDPVAGGAAAIQALAEALDRKGVRAYSQITADVNVTATTEAAGTVVVTAPSIAVLAGEILLIEIFSPAARPNAASIRLLDSVITEDGTGIGRIARIMFSAPNPLDLRYPLYGAIRHAPAAGNHVYAWKGVVNADTALIQAGPGGVDQIAPAFLRISVE